ncbi:hypothetical protein [Ktedonobacter racemifer]|uniref:Retrotransposon hot spot (RHS) protein n=1 Tax=Ktedonobacter racemifer DSM 44963 TaxID=485913 RepID=D6U2A7_KTERA|nr:hypothetical protein [Ktedonobacter racemifer]EFH82775.1 retrotransposon hot spot (RHS) protein [Ktedonobacter racemifer DSM 44963]
MSSNSVAQGRDDEDRGQQHQAIVDPVLAYVQAWDAKRFGDLERILNSAGREEGALCVAFRAIFLIFDPAIPYTEQLLKFRATGHIGA